MTSAFSKASVFAVHINSIGLRFQMSPLWTAFSNVCVFDETLSVFDRCRVDWAVLGFGTTVLFSGYLAFSNKLLFFSQSANGRNSANPAIWLVPGAGKIFLSCPQSTYQRTLPPGMRCPSENVLISATREGRCEEAFTDFFTLYCSLNVVKWMENYLFYILFVFSPFLSLQTWLWYGRHLGPRRRRKQSSTELL